MYSLYKNNDILVEFLFRNEIKVLQEYKEKFISLGASRLGTSRLIKIMKNTDNGAKKFNLKCVGVTYGYGSLAVGLAEKRDRKIGSQHYNSQAALFGQSVKEMTKLLELIGGKPENIIHGAGDLYVTIFGGRTRKIGTLLGRGLSFEEAMAELQGVTLESIVISTRTARAVRKLAERGIVSLEDFPLLMHVDAIINQGAEVNIPWKDFTWNDFSLAE